MLQPKIIKVLPLEKYQLLLTFETKEEKVFNVAPYISGDWYGKLKNPQYFNTVHISGSSIEWADGQDIAPHELYENSQNIVK